MPPKKRLNKSPEQLQKKAEMSKLRKAFNIQRQIYGLQLTGREAEVRHLLASRWQQWCDENSHCNKEAMLASSPRKEQHTIRFHTNKTTARMEQVTLYLSRNSTHMNDMVATLNSHPLAVGSDGKPIAFLYLDGKVNDQSKEDDHESAYNLKFCSVLGFNLTCGYSRYRDKGDTTHAWLAFGEGCTSRWQWYLGTDLLLNLVGYKCMYGSHMRAKEPLQGEGAPFGDWSPYSPIIPMGWPVQHMQQAAAVNTAASSSDEFIFTAIQEYLAQPALPSVVLPMPPSRPVPLSAAPTHTSQPLAVAPSEAAEEPNPDEAPEEPATHTSQPLAGAPFLAETSPPLVGAASSSRATEEVAEEPDPDEAPEVSDYVGLDYRPVLGEEAPEDEQENSDRMKQAEQDGDWFLLQEMQFKSRVSAITRSQSKHQKMWLTPAPRFKPAVGGSCVPGVGGTLSIDMELHAWALRLGAEFNLRTLSQMHAPPSHAENLKEKFFVGMATSRSIFSRKRLEEEPLALLGTAVGVHGWKLGDDLPNTDVETGVSISDGVFAKRWDRDKGKLMRHLIKKHEGELKELSGHWVESADPVRCIPDTLFDPQFCLNELDFNIARWLDRQRQANASKFADTYLWMAKGKGKSKSQASPGKGKGETGEVMKEELAVGSKGQYIVDTYLKGTQGKGKQVKGKGVNEQAAAGGKGNAAWISSTLHMNSTGWKYREGSYLDLATLFFKLGKYYTATQLYRYWNTLPPLTTKKPHPWGSPWLQAAACERYRQTGFYGHTR